ncbi:metallo-beta-lactamase family protein [Dehalogenimonas formicexedens]|uniref:Metallo-beta-lactamase family protein n=1 Tax=Dehalogenimonas formicexedens TaxID=1839801 RepID=A0A1P8F8V8_9CHLR|nr:MBL fold metallo-hydrolase [Dehalogenimonas formicexedens]APV44852.1 metallo-beta-lactamase family protein [Dehalogenimonas formicexedens]
MPKLTFLGAAGNVTGSRYLFEGSETQLLVDCGLYQEREFLSRNWDPTPLKPSEIDAVILTHAHLDHCGLLPKLVHDGFRGKVYATDATLEMAEVMLLDSARIQEEDADFKKRRHEREGQRGAFPELPLYTVEDAKNTFPLFHPVRYGETIEFAGVKATLQNAGHVLGSAMVYLECQSRGKARSLCFSGDIGRPKSTLLTAPRPPSVPDYLVMEATYGDRDHPPAADVEGTLASVINETISKGGNVVIPAFALERTQELLFFLKKLMATGKIPKMTVYVDSPMAIELTVIFSRHPELLGAEAGKSANFGFPGLKLTASVEESKAIAHDPKPCIIIAGSGMATGGRIKHHLVNNITRPESTILFVGYQSRGTLGRAITDGQSPVRILGQMYDVRARVEQLQGLSAHAGRSELMDWITGLGKSPTRIFITHSEEDSANSFAQALRERTGWPVTVPAYGESFEL